MKLGKILEIVRKLNEEAVVSTPTNNASGGAIAGLPPDQPPVNLKKKKRPTIMGNGCFPGARKRWSNG